MSHEVSIHKAQTAILRELLFTPSAGFAELQRPTGLASDHFNFHISRLVELDLVTKEGSGKYRLTTKGKEYANRLDTDERTIERQGKVAVLVLPIRDNNGVTEYMLQERLKQPFWGYIGLLSGKLRWGEPVLVGAARELKEETGLTADLTLKGIYHKLDYATDGRLLEDKHFYMVRAFNLDGHFMASFEGGKNHWYTRDQIPGLEHAFEGIDLVIDTMAKPRYQFLEKNYTYSEVQY